MSNLLSNWQCRPSDVKRLHKNGFHSRELDNTNDAHKEECRNRVAEFIAAYHPPSLSPVLFSMPSIRWSFEHQINQMMPIGQFIAIERSRKAINAAIELKTPIGQLSRKLSDVCVGGRLRGLIGGRSVIIHSKLSVFLRNYFKNLSADWVETLGGCTCVWLDFCSELCAEVTESLRLIGYMMNADAPYMPIAVTVLACREKGATNNMLRELSHDGKISTELRALYITRMLNQGPLQFTMHEYFDYQSPNKRKMLTVMGTFQRT